MYGPQTLHLLNCFTQKGQILRMMDLKRPLQLKFFLRIMTFTALWRRTAGALDSYRLTERKIRFSFGPKEYQISARRPAVGRAFQVMPIACSAFGGQIPPPQTPVKFKVVMDHKTGRPRADFVRPQFGIKGGKGSVKSSPAPAPAVETAVPGGVYIGQVTRVKGNFGFIQPDDGAEEVFFMPRGCKGFHGPPAPGMRVSFEMVNDEKTGRPRADHIFPEAAQGESSPAELLGSNMTGTICDPGDKFGFITQDDGSSMFVLPGSCSAFGMVIPPAGTRVLYDVVADPKTGRPRAENVQPSDSGGLVTALKGKEKGGVIPARCQLQKSACDFCAMVRCKSGFCFKWCWMAFFLLNAWAYADSDLQHCLEKDDSSNDSLRLLQKREGQALGRSDHAGEMLVDCNQSVMDLSSHGLDTWPLSTEAYCPLLQLLDLSKNSIQEVPKNAFSKMPNLKILLLNMNKIQTFPDISSLKKLSQLDLSSNNIKDLPQGALYGNPELIHLDLHRNKLTFLPQFSTWLGKPNLLNILNLAHNQIKSIGPSDPFGILDPLDWLDLSSNKLTYIPGGLVKALMGTDNAVLLGNPLSCRSENCESRVTAEGTGVKIGGGETLFALPLNWCQLPLCEATASTNSTNTTNTTNERTNLGPSKMLEQEMLLVLEPGTWTCSISWEQTCDLVAAKVISRICNGYGFIDKEDGESMFVLPTSCKAFAGGGGFAELPPVGTPVDYDIVMDSKTGRPRAENVRPAMRDGVFVGTISKSGAQFGFITQDTQDGSVVEMFVLPFSCGGQIPPVGTRVTYTVVEDSKTGRPRAENVMMLGLRQAAPAGPVMQAPPAQSMNYHGMEMAMAMSGSIIQAGPTYGFIQPDDGGDKMFVLPGSCTACGDVAIPPVGTRVTYYETIDQKTGKPRADQVQLEAAQWASESAGNIIECGTRYGFIKQDNGENMFVMPAACAAFG
eukprot:symbB.v1.2.037172.t2/scaffold5412.1/size27432/1